MSLQFDLQPFPYLVVLADLAGLVRSWRSRSSDQAHQELGDVLQTIARSLGLVHFQQSF